VKRNWALVAAALVALGLLVWPSSHHARLRKRSIHSAAARVEAAREHDDAVRAAGGDLGAAAELTEDAGIVDDRFTNRSIGALMDRLSSPDQTLVLDAADGLRARKATFAIPKLASIDIVQNADAARTVIDAMGQLAGMATGPDHTTAVDRLLALLAQEKARDRRDAVGNVLQLYEALGDTADRRAADALERELADPNVPMAALTVVTASLVKLAQPSSKSALESAKTRVQDVVPEDDFGRELQKEVVQKMAAAIEAF
jgi:hypothetical protein